jgi:hypothetical protein
MSHRCTYIFAYLSDFNIIIVTYSTILLCFILREIGRTVSERGIEGGRGDSEKERGRERVSCVFFNEGRRERGRERRRRRRKRGISLPLKIDPRHFGPYNL